MRALVTGSREWQSLEDVGSTLLSLALPPGSVIIHGACRGADMLADTAAKSLGFAVEPYPVDHAIDGPWPGAGPRRNERMVRESRPDVGVAFGALRRADQSKTGTGGCCKIMWRRGLAVLHVAEPGAAGKWLGEREWRR